MHGGIYRCTGIYFFKSATVKSKLINWFKASKIKGTPIDCPNMKLPKNRWMIYETAAS